MDIVIHLNHPGHVFLLAISILLLLTAGHFISDNNSNSTPVPGILIGVVCVCAIIITVGIMIFKSF